jgi:lysophospholipase L1-like esterase
MYEQYNSLKIKKAGWVIFFVAILVVAGFWLWPEDKITNFPSAGRDIIAFGDSLVTGVGATPGKDFVSQIQNKIGDISIINKGRPGETTGEGLQRIDEALGSSPKVVMLLLGGNDALRRVSVDQTFSNLKRIIDKIHAKGAVVILLGVQGGVLTDKYSSHFKSLAKETGSLYVSNVLDGIFGHPDLMSDSIHPNDRGYSMIAERVTPVLSKALSK